MLWRLLFLMGGMMAQAVITAGDLDSEFAIVDNKVSLKLLAPLYQDGVTGAIGVAGVTAKQYLQVYRTDTFQALAVNGDVIFNGQGLVNGIGYDVATGVATLTAGKVYRLTVALAASNFNNVSAWLRCAFVEGTSNLFISTLPPLEIRMTTNTLTGFSPVYLELLYGTTVDLGIKLRCIAANAGSSCRIRFDAYSGLVIQEL